MMKKLFPFLLVALLLADPSHAGMIMRGGGGGGTEIIGNTTVQTITSTSILGNIACSGKTTVSNTGEITEISWYIQNTSGTADIKVGAYLDSVGEPTTPIGTEKEFLNIGTFGPGWYSFDVSGQGMNVTAGQTIWLCGITNSAGFTIYYDSAPAGSRYLDPWTYTTAWSTSTSPTSGSSIYSVKGVLTY